MGETCITHTGRWKMEALFLLGSHAKTQLERNMHKAGDIVEL